MPSNTMQNIFLKSSRKNKLNTCLLKEFKKELNIKQLRDRISFNNLNNLNNNTNIKLITFPKQQNTVSKLTMLMNHKLYKMNTLLHNNSMFLNK